MLRFLIGYILGAIFGFLAVVSFIVQPTNEGMFFTILFGVITCGVGLTWCHKHHIKKREDYYRKIRGGR